MSGEMKYIQKEEIISILDSAGTKNNSINRARFIISP